RLDDFQGDLAADRLLLLGDEDEPEPALADLLAERVGADDGPLALRDRRLVVLPARVPGSGRPHKRPRPAAGVEQALHPRRHPGPPLGGAGAGLVEECGPIGLDRDLDGPAEHGLPVGYGSTHGSLRDGVYPSVRRPRLAAARIIDRIPDFSFPTRRGSGRAR